MSVSQRLKLTAISTAIDVAGIKTTCGSVLFSYSMSPPRTTYIAQCSIEALEEIPERCSACSFNNKSFSRHPATTPPCSFYLISTGEYQGR